MSNAAAANLNLNQVRLMITCINVCGGLQLGMATHRCTSPAVPERKSRSWNSKQLSTSHSSARQCTWLEFACAHLTNAHQSPADREVDVHGTKGHGTNKTRIHTRTHLQTHARTHAHMYMYVYAFVTHTHTHTQHAYLYPSCTWPFAAAAETAHAERAVRGVQE